VLGAELAPWQITYDRIAGLGGLRGRSRDVPTEVNGYWDNQSFHNYADYALSPAFGAALDELIADAATEPSTGTAATSSRTAADKAAVPDTQADPPPKKWTGLGRPALGFGWADVAQS